MKKFDFPLYSDVLFYSLCVGALSFCVLRYFRIPLALCFLVSTLLLLATGALVLFFLDGSHRKKRLTKKQAEEQSALMLHLALEKPERVRATLLTALIADGKEAHLLDEDLCIDGTPAVCLFTMQPLSADTVARLLRRFQTQPFLLICNQLSPESLSLLHSFQIQAWCAGEVYALFSRTESTPSPLICGNLPRRTIKTRARAFVRKSNARPFFVSGLLLLFMSLFAIFPVYYLSVGGALIVAAIAVRLFGYSPA